MRQRVSCLVLSGLFLLLAAADIVQLVEIARGEHPDPPGLIVLHAITGILAGITAMGIWRARRWAVVAALCWGLLTSGMLVALGPLLNTPSEDCDGLWVAAAFVLVLTLTVSGYLLHILRTDTKQP